MVILDHDSRRINIAEWRSAFRPTLPLATPLADHPRYREKIHRFFRAFESLPLSTRFALDAPAAAEACDCVVVGSDEVWNLSHPWYGRCALFYGDGLDGRRLVSYAASFGSHDASRGLEQAWAERLRRFEHISVRDEFSRQIVENAMGSRPQLVLDPCLQFPSVAVVCDGEPPPPAPYAGVYGHGFSQPFARQVRRWAARRKLPLVSIGYRNDWADHQWIGAGPLEFARFTAGAEAVATNFFHGCVFALRSSTPFVCEESPYRSNKIRGLIATIGSHAHLLHPESATTACEAVLSRPLDPQILQRLDELRAGSTRYLDSALAGQPGA